MSGGVPNSIGHVGFDRASGLRDCERIVLLRYDEMHSGRMFASTNMALMAAICNAHQYPHSHLTIFGPRGMQICHDITGGSGKGITRAPTLQELAMSASSVGGSKDEVCALEMMFEDVSAKYPSQCYHPFAASLSKQVHFFNRERDEIPVFKEMNPPFFFIVCKLTKCDIDKGSTVVEPLLVAAFRKGGTYYLFGGQKKCKLYKIEDPIWLFFSSEGHDRLEAILAAPYGQYISVKIDHYHYYCPRCLICVPTGEYPSVNWSDYS